MAISAILGATALLSTAVGSTYTDPSGDIATGNSNLDIVSVGVSHDDTDLTVSMTVADLDADWGKYMLFIDSIDGGSGDNDNPWQRDVGGLGGMDMFMGTWLDGGGGTEMYVNIDGGWVPFLMSVTLDVDWGTNTINWTLEGFVPDLLSLGASSFEFEVGTTGGGEGDPAIDLLGGEGTQPGWGGGSTSTDRAYYAIPAPGALALLGLAGLAGRRRRRH